MEVDLGQDPVQRQDAARDGAALLVEQVQQGGKGFVRPLVEELPELGLLGGQPVADNRVVAGFELPRGADRGAVVRGNRRAPLPDEALENAGEALRGGLPAGLGDVQFGQEPGADLVGEVVEFVHLQDVTEAGEVRFQRGDAGVRRRCLRQPGACGIEQRTSGGHARVEGLVLALQHGRGFGAGLVLVPRGFDAGAKRFEVGLCGEGVLEALLDPGELLAGHGGRDLFPGPVVLGHPAQGFKLPGHALVRLFPALRQLGGLGQLLLQVLNLGRHEFELGGIVEPEDVVLAGREAVILFHRVAVALDHTAQAQALVQAGELVRVFHTRVGEVEGNPFAEPGAGLRKRLGVWPGGQPGIGEETELGQQVAIGHVLDGQRTAGQGPGDVHGT